MGGRQAMTYAIYFHAQFSSHFPVCIYLAYSCCLLLCILDPRHLSDLNDIQRTICVKTWTVNSNTLLRATASFTDYQAYHKNMPEENGCCHAHRQCIFTFLFTMGYLLPLIIASLIQPWVTLRQLPKLCLRRPRYHHKSTIIVF